MQALSPGISLANTIGMKHILLLIAFLLMTACARKVEVRGPEMIKKDGYAYLKDDDGRVYIVTSSTKDFDQALKTIHPGPSTVDKLDLWVVTPLATEKK